MSADLESLAAAVASWAGDAVGVGVDIEEVGRWRSLDERRSALFTEDEHAHAASFEDPAQSLAGMWAAKEAAWKATSGFVAIDLRDITIAHDPDGRPHAVLRTDVDVEVVLSIGHTTEQAIAFAVARRAG